MHVDEVRVWRDVVEDKGVDSGERRGVVLSKGGEGGVGSGCEAVRVGLGREVDGYGGGEGLGEPYDCGEGEEMHRGRVRKELLVGRW